MNTATVTVEAKSWTEQRIAESDPSHAVASVVFTTQWSGDLVGSSTCGLLIDYVAGDPARPETLEGPYVGYEQVTGALAGRSGSFVLATRGTHGGGVADTEVEVVPGSGTGELAGLTGSGSYAADAMTYTLTLHYEFR
ncbi:DUF3224 domain-containing protein [Jatrophihabitans endophyticus]|uniref:DUF3224 domain-containing protein n=1 Tax=Jatrophihabitans endophyticus TaxID=1206085 RepID=UPI0019FC40E7|nr:DUF3224 domain-containing protein [Jatrophihabitans endophyticus]MBE7189125.1 DUF3224 domain-containing protein [Jatrophihabitans endophyticus]